MAKLILEDSITSYTSNLEEAPTINEVVEAFLYGCKALSYTDENIYKSLKNIVEFYEENNKVVD
jgi:hypothetical protein